MRVNSRRSENEILADILNMANGRVNKTKILYQGNLSYTQMEKYLAFLQDKGLLEEETDPSKTRIYKTTAKGLEFLAICKKLRLFLEERFTESLKHTPSKTPLIDAPKLPTPRSKKGEGEQLREELWRRLLKILPSEAEAEAFLREKGYLPIENKDIQKWEKMALKVRKKEEELQRLREDLGRVEDSLKEKIPCVQ